MQDTRESPIQVVGSAQNYDSAVTNTSSTVVNILVW